ncbi:MAG: hypothetical protein LUD48_06235 [Prevotella sp.]|nr:hypothetical protein [Prevotella sp.]
MEAIKQDIDNFVKNDFNYKGYFNSEKELKDTLSSEGIESFVGENFCYMQNNDTAKEYVLSNKDILKEMCSDEKTPFPSDVMLDMIVSNDFVHLDSIIRLDLFSKAIDEYFDEHITELTDYFTPAFKKNLVCVNDSIERDI